MKLSFSTNGWDLKISEILPLLEENKIKGLEIHDINAPRFNYGADFEGENILRLKRALFESGVSISCIDALSNLADVDNFATAEEEIRKLVGVSAKVGCEFVRLHAYENEIVKKNYDEIYAFLVKNLRALVDFAEENGVTLLMETMGIFSDTEKLAKFLGEFSSDNFSALWDIHNTHRFAGEKPEDSVKNLGKHIKHIHVKDSFVKPDGKIEYCLMGEGDLPIKWIVKSLRSVNYEGYVSLELFPDRLGGLGDAGIVIPQFASVMPSLDGAPWGSTLYVNNRGTGNYIWEKETLIEKTFSQVLDKVVEEFPDQIAFKYTTLDYTRTYSEFRDEVDVVARSLMAIGVKPGDHVAVWATNIPEWYLTFWATTKIGAVLVTMNTAYKIHEAEYLLKQSDTHTLVLIKGYRDSDYAGIINELCPELKT
ncbi:MAG: AMP-binding protein, partial [Clostridia bacterium]|nr:AMP-binding protein [Clostridia bacterium]